MKPRIRVLNDHKPVAKNRHEDDVYEAIKSYCAGLKSPYNGIIPATLAQTMNIKPAQLQKALQRLTEEGVLMRINRVGYSWSGKKTTYRVRVVAPPPQE